MVMYGVYNTETLEKLMNIRHQMHNTTTLNEKLFTGELSTAFTWYVNKNGVHHYPITLLLYHQNIKGKNMSDMCEEFIMQLHIVSKNNKNSNRGLFTNFSYITNKITINAKCSSNGNSKDQPRL